MESNDETPTPTPDSSVQSQATRGKLDPRWAHCTVTSASDKKQKNIVCLYCAKSIKSGGINRFKQHLAGVKGETRGCPKVSAQIRFEMHANLEMLVNKKKSAAEKRDYHGESDSRDNGKSPYMESEDYVEEVKPPSTAAAREKGKGLAPPPKRVKARDSIFMPRTTKGAQPSIRSVLQSKVAKEKVDIAVAKWMIDASISFNAANSPHFHMMFDAACSFGAGYKAPNFYDLRGFLLTKNVEQVKEFVASFRSTWKETGCTIMADDWTDQQRRTLINFLVYCPIGTIFLKSVDASDASKTADMLFKLFKEVVLSVGVENVVHFVTDNAANYVAAGRLLENEFPSLFWSLCAAYCINLMLQDIDKPDEVNSVVAQAYKITKYVYNHCFLLYLIESIQEVEKSYLLLQQDLPPILLHYKASWPKKML